MYDATYLAQYIVTLCTKKGLPATNLKLQKLLYFLWIDFFKIRKEYLFKNVICAWPLGPVVPDVYDEFCAYGGLPIRKQFDVRELPYEDKSIIDSFLSRFMPISAHQLVDESHAEGKPWSKVFSNGTGRGHQIPFELIIEDECT